jgi:hypothetical protein
MTSRNGYVASCALDLRNGKTDRSTRFLWRDLDVSGSEEFDVTDEVLAAAGPETSEETAKRKQAHEDRWHHDLEWALEEDLLRELEWGSKYVRGHHVRAAEADDDSPDELIYERDDGKRYLVEIQVTVRPE